MVGEVRPKWRNYAWPIFVWGAALSPIIALFALGYVFMEVQPVSNRKLGKLNAGMTSNEVVAVLGRPSQINGTNWVYTRSMLWIGVYARFDQQGRFSGYEVDR